MIPGNYLFSLETDLKLACLFLKDHCLSSDSRWLTVVHNFYGCSVQENNLVSLISSWSDVLTSSSLESGMDKAHRKYTSVESGFFQPFEFVPDTENRNLMTIGCLIDR